jgi:hypothetical protein
MDGKVAHIGFTPARIEEIRNQLLDPFDPAEIKWRVTATASQQGRNGPVKRGQLVAYADQRAYTDRLNDIFGEWGWTRTYSVQVAQNFERTLNKGGNGQKQSVICAKVVVVSTVSVSGLGSHTGVGEEWADDENSATRAEAQAFKRACACFGLGRYLYDLDKVWEDLDQYNRPVRNPNLPDWALPAHARTRTAAIPSAFGGPTQPRQGLVQRDVGQSKGCARRLVRSSKFLRNAAAWQMRQDRIREAYDGFEKLATWQTESSGFQRQRNCPKGVCSICRELNFASDSLDDIPDRDGLCALLKRVEAEVGTATTGATQQQVHGSIEELRGKLLQAARKVADSGRTGWPAKFGDVIAQATDGKVTLERLKSLADADAPVLEAALSKLAT